MDVVGESNNVMGDKSEQKPTLIYLELQINLF